MTQINSKLVLASKNTATGDILYTFVWTYPRIILAEVNTHRMLSRNSASSRAIPQKKQRANVVKDPFVPVSLGGNQKGMQAGAEITGWRRWAIESIWRGSRYPMVAAQWAMEKLGAHKQVGNRLLEPWMWVQTVVSATDLKNLIKLRAHWMAEPHFRILAEQVKSQVACVEHWFNKNTYPLKNEIIIGGDKVRVQWLGPGEWHLPFVDEHDYEYGSDGGAISTLKMISAARCARVSYYLPDSGKRSDAKRDVGLYDRLVVRGWEQDKGNGHMNDDPIHASPVEHQAMALTGSHYAGNFKGWLQHRKEIKGEDGGDRE